MHLCWSPGSSCCRSTLLCRIARWIWLSVYWNSVRSCSRLFLIRLRHCSGCRPPMIFIFLIKSGGYGTSSARFSKSWVWAIFSYLELPILSRAGRMYFYLNSTSLILFWSPMNCFFFKFFVEECWISMDSCIVISLYN